MSSGRARYNVIKTVEQMNTEWMTDRSMPLHNMVRLAVEERSAEKTSWIYTRPFTRIKMFIIKAEVYSELESKVSSLRGKVQGKYAPQKLDSDNPQTHYDRRPSSGWTLKKITFQLQAQAMLTSRRQNGRVGQSQRPVKKISWICNKTSKETLFIT